MKENGTMDDFRVAGNNKIGVNFGEWMKWRKMAKVELEKVGQYGPIVGARDTLRECSDKSTCKH
jgi:hypothetical protein